MPPVDKPSYTQIPNAILDNMASLRGAALKVAIAVYYHEAALGSDGIPLSRDRLQRMTGLDDSTLRGAVADAVDGGWITHCAAAGSVRI